MNKDFRALMNNQENRMLDATMEAQWKVDSGEQIDEGITNRIRQSTNRFLKLAEEYEEARLKEESERAKEYE